MTTHPHTNAKNGYAIRISKNLPKEAANLSYVHVDKPTPSKNISLKDFTQNIQENKTTENNEIIYSYINKEGYLQINEELFKTKNRNILITNEYANNNNETPLFYKYRAKKPLDVENIEVSIPLTGNRLSKSKYIHEYQDGKENRFVYEGEKITITKTSNIPLEKSDVFKFVLEKENNKYYLVVYSAKELTEDGYVVNYQSKVDNKITNISEVINFKTVFAEEVQIKNYASKENYQIIENEDYTYSVKVDTTNENFLITEKEREPYTFEYQLKVDVDTTLSDKNPYKVNIGIIYLNNNIFNALETTNALKKIVYNNPYMPKFISFDNPHRKNEGINNKEDSQYWEASLSMPREHWMDYDVLIISGYGEYDIAKANDSIQYYLSHGGILYVETAGEGAESLQLVNNNITSISYSKENNATGTHIVKKESIRNRYYEVGNIYSDEGISPEINFTGQENRNDWEVYIHQNNNNPSIIKKTTEDVGQLIYSNMGLMKSILFNNVESIKLLVNLMLTSLEKRSFIMPKRKEFVYHKDDLYENEYYGTNEERVYYNDKSDEDQTQIVAKKIINKNINNSIRPYLPKAYKNWESVNIKTKLFDEKQVYLENNQFNLIGNKTEFTETDIHGIPGFRYNVFSGNQSIGKHIVSDETNNKNYIQIETINTQAFFEQELEVLSPGNYILEVNAKSQDTELGGVGLYDALGEPFKILPIHGTRNWEKLFLEFEIKESKRLFLRLGAHNDVGTSNLKFNEIHLTNKGSIRMNEESKGNETLYAYVVSPKGKNNSLTTYEATYNNPEILKQNKQLKTNLRIKSYVYRWDSETGTNVRLIGNEKETPIVVNTKDREVVLGNILEFLPPLYSGVEWTRKQNVYYEIELDNKQQRTNKLNNDDFINLSMYDPTTDKYFYTSDGSWVINHNDIWHDSQNTTIQLRAKTNFYHLVATNNKFTIGFSQNKEFKVELPYTQNERDKWHLRIQNGVFSKTTTNAKELSELRKVNKENQYENFLLGKHVYEMPEYSRQAFYPYYGERLINEELATYINPKKIEVANTPMVINEIKVNKERLRPNSSGTVWSSQNIFWDSAELPSVYLDQNNTGRHILLTSGYKINYYEGKIILDKPIKGTIYASYSHDNFKICKRDFKNKNVSSELLKSQDGYAYHLKNKNITVMPSPRLYTGEISKETLIPSSSYWVDYREGVVHFSKNISGRIYASYSYFTEKELTYKNVNKNTGEIFLNERISFKDEIYVSYLIKENTLEYKGYYNEELGKFIYLDLNPSAGHTFTYQTEDTYEELEGHELLDKEVFVYLLPKRSTYYKTEVNENHTVRHVFNEEQWLRIKESRPEAILIAQLQVRENTNKENIIMMDSRRQGGGLKENLSDEEIERRVGYTSAFWDIGSFDGLAYYRNGVLVLRVPEKVLRVNGGHFTEDEVRTIVDKYIAYGTYPIIEFVEE